MVWCRSIGLFLIAGLSAAQDVVPSITQIRNAASHVSAEFGVAPRSLISIYGSTLSRDIQRLVPPLPTNAGGVRVLIDGHAAPLLYVSPAQINAVVPSDIPITFSTPTDAPVRTVEVVVENGTSRSSPVRIPIAAKAIGIFNVPTDCGRALALNVHPDGSVSVNSAENSFDPDRDVALTFFGTGAGRPRVNQPDNVAWRFDAQAHEPGFGAYAGHNITFELPPASLGPVAYLGPAPALIGVDQMNVLLTDEGRRNVPEGCRVPLHITHEGDYAISSQEVAVSIRRGGGRCSDPVSSGYGLFRWERREEVDAQGRTQAAEGLRIRLWRAPNLFSLDVARLRPVAIDSTTRRLPQVAECRSIVPEVLDAGTIVLQGPGFGPLTVTAQNSRTSNSEIWVPLPQGNLRRGDYEVRTSGGRDVGAFVSKTTLSDPITLTTPSASTPVLRFPEPYILWTGQLENSQSEVDASVQSTSFISGSDGTGTWLSFLGGSAPAREGRLRLTWDSRNPPQSDAYSSLRVVMGPQAINQEIVSGISGGIVHTWHYEYRLPDVKLQ